MITQEMMIARMLVLTAEEIELAMEVAERALDQTFVSEEATREWFYDAFNGDIVLAEAMAMTLATAMLVEEEMVDQETIDARVLDLTAEDNVLITEVAMRALDQEFTSEDQLREWFEAECGGDEVLAEMAAVLFVVAMSMTSAVE